MVKKFTVFDLFNPFASVKAGNTIIPYAPFYGYSEVNVTSITIPSIDKPEGALTGIAPFSLMTSAKNVTCTGTRNLTAKPIHPYEHLEYTWLVTKLDGSPITYNGEITNPETGAIVNPYTDTISPEGTFLLHEVGDYKLKLTAKGKTDTGYITQTFEETITVTKPVVDHAWYDGTNGNDANDGLDPNGFALTTAAYTEATGELTQVGAFTAYDHALATNDYCTNNSNFIYISKAGFEGLYEIESKTSNDTVVLKDKLGSDQISVTSSDGAKATFVGTPVSNRREHLAGGNTYLMTASYNTVNKNGDVGLIGYNGTPIVQKDSGYMFNPTTSASTPDSPTKMTLSNIVLDGRSLAIPCETGYSSSADTGTVHATYDRLSVLKSSASGAILFSMTSIKNAYFTMWGGFLDNLKATTEDKRIALYYKFSNTDSWSSICGLVIDNDADNGTLDHFIYPSFQAHANFGWIHFRGGTNSSYCINTNSNLLDGNPVKNVSVHDCFSDGNSNYFMDLSKSANNNSDTGTFEDVVVARNNITANNGFMFYYTGLSLFAVANKFWSSTATFPMFKEDIADPTYYIEEDHASVLEGNYNYGSGIIDETNGAHREAVNNVAYSLNTTAITAKVSQNALGVGNELAIEGNRFYAPNDTDGLHLDSGTGVETLSEFNAGIGGLNVELDPYWLDPVNGDFSDIAKPLASGTLSFPDAKTIRQATFSTAELFSEGRPYHYSAVNLPEGAVINELNGLIKASVSIAGTYPDISVTGANSLGESTTNTASMTFVLLEAPVIGTLDLPAATEGLLYSYTVPYTGDAPISATLVSGVMADGITFNTETWTFEGRPTTSTDITGISVSLTNEAGTSSTSNTDTLVIDPKPLYLTLKSASSSYMTFATNTLANIGDSVELNFLVNSGDTTANVIIDDGGGYGTGIKFNINNNVVWISDARITLVIDDVDYVSGDSVSHLVDGLYHTAILTAIATGTHMGRLGADHVPQFFLDGSVADITIQKSGLVTTWGIHSGSTTVESPSIDEIGIGDMTFVNVVAGDWA